MTTTQHTYNHGDLVLIKSDQQVAMVDYHGRDGLIYIFDALADFDVVAFFPDEIEPWTGEENHA